MQRIVRNIILNVTQQIFVRRDPKSGRSVLPLNFKGAASVEIGESGDWSFLSFDLAIASDAGQMASDDQSDTPNKQSDQDLSHVKYLLRYDAATLPFGFNKAQGGTSLQSSPAARLAAFAEATAPKETAAVDHCTIFIFTASTSTLST
jgi:hypothetical protein